MSQLEVMAGSAHRHGKGPATNTKLQRLFTGKGVRSVDPALGGYLQHRVARGNPSDDTPLTW